MYYLLACADDIKVVAETVESNNCLASTARISITPESARNVGAALKSLSVAPITS